MLVSPFRNQSSSWMIERRCSFLVVTSGKPSRQIEAHLVAEDGERAGAGAVVLADALVEDAAEKIEIGLHALGSSPHYRSAALAPGPSRNSVSVPSLSNSVRACLYWGCRSQDRLWR